MSPGRARLPRSRRITQRTAFRETMQAGRRSRDSCFSIYVSTVPTARTQLGVTVGRRVSTRAVRRNRIKRHIRESFRTHQHLLTGLRVVVTANPIADAKTNAELRALLEKHWEQISPTCNKRRPDLPQS